MNTKYFHKAAFQGLFKVWLKNMLLEFEKYRLPKNVAQCDLSRLTYW